MRWSTLGTVTWRLSSIKCMRKPGPVSSTRRLYQGRRATPAAAAATLGTTKTKPPLARTVHDKDPFVWMEEQTDEVLHHLHEENRYTCEVMKDTTQLQKEVYKELMAHLDGTGGGAGGGIGAAPERCNGYWYYTRREEGGNFPVYYRSRNRPTLREASGWIEAKESVVLDQNELPEFYQYFHVGDMKVSPDNRLLAFTLAGHDSSSGAGTLYLRDLTTCSTDASWWTAECWASVAGFEWGGDHVIFFTKEDHLGRPSEVYRCDLQLESQGLRRPPSLIYREGDDRFFVSLRRTKDGKFITINSNSKTSSEVHVLATSHEGGDGVQPEPRLLRARTDGVQYFVDHHGGGHFFIATNARKPSGEYELCRCPSSLAGTSEWDDCLSDSEASMGFIEDIDIFRDFCVLYDRCESVPGVRVLDLRSLSPGSMSMAPSHRIPLPHHVQAGRLQPGLNQDYESTTVRFSFTSPIMPSLTYDYDMVTRELTVVERVPITSNGDSDHSLTSEQMYVCERVLTEASLEGPATQVPLTIVYKQGLVRDGSHPVLLVGYGAYGVNLEVGYKPEYLPLLNRGWVLAFAHVRGGGEMGRAWHVAGRGRHKPKSISDYLGCARWLIEQGYTTSGRLAAYGSSAGGLLVGAAANRRPELFGAMVLKVPFLDIVRTMTDPSLPLTIHEYDEWGDPGNDDEILSTMRSYSPYETLPIMADTGYPDTLVLASLADDRVRYWEAVKWVAKARLASQQSTPLLLLRMEAGRGHAGHATQSDMMHESAFEWAFLLNTLGPLSSSGSSLRQPPGLVGRRRRGGRKDESPYARAPVLAWLAKTSPVK